MKQFMRLMLSFLFFLSPGSVFANGTFTVGIAPHTSTRIILDMYQPLRRYMAKSLNLDVSIVTAPNFTDFAKRALAGNYDLLVTTGHQARVLQKDAHYIPLLTYKAVFKAVVLAAKEGPIHTPEDARCMVALGLSPSSLVTMWGQHWLADNGVSMPVRFVSASDSVAKLVLAGEAAIGFTSLANYQNLCPNIQARLRIIAESPPLAGRVYMLNGGHFARKSAVLSALWSFSHTPEAGVYFATYKLEGYRKLEPNELEAMDKYSAELRQILEKGEE